MMSKSVNKITENGVNGYFESFGDCAHIAECK